MITITYQHLLINLLYFFMDVVLLYGVYWMVNYLREESLEIGKKSHQVYWS